MKSSTADQQVKGEPVDVIDRKQLKAAGGPTSWHHNHHTTLNTIPYFLRAISWHHDQPTTLYRVYYTLYMYYTFSPPQVGTRTTGAPTPPTGFNTLAGLGAFAAFDLSHFLWHFFLNQKDRPHILSM